MPFVNIDSYASDQFTCICMATFLLVEIVFVIAVFRSAAMVSFYHIGEQFNKVSAAIHYTEVKVNL